MMPLTGIKMTINGEVGEKKKTESILASLASLVFSQRRKVDYKNANNIRVLIDKQI